MPNVSQQLSPEAAALPGSFSLAPFGQGAALGPLQYYKQKYPDAITKVGTIVGNQASAVAAWHYQKQAMESLGYKVIYEDDFPPAQNNFTADVISMRNQGVKMVYIIAVNAPDAADFSAEAAQQGWKPEVFAAPVAYFGQYVAQAGGAAAVEGQYVNVGAARFLGEDAASNPEVALFGKWIKVVNSSFAVDQFSAYSWANAAYFVKALQAVGPHVTRKGVLAALAAIHQFDDNGMMAPTDPGKKVTASCFDILQLQGGKYVRVDDPPTGYRCDGGYYTFHG
jgi:ABC-type branched-subunit amino acid transport system substrate-binding protein